LLNTSTKLETLKLDFFSYLKALFNLMKPRVMSLVIFTCVVGLLIAPVKVNFLDAVFSLFAVALGSGAAGALNMWYEADLDSVMTRTCLRPIPTGKVTKNQALIFGISASIISIVVLYFFSNLVATTILAITILFYVFIYTIWLKRKTPQNIVIGGAAGALPPVIGWAIATGDIAFQPVILFLIIFKPFPCEPKRGFHIPYIFFSFNFFKIFSATANFSGTQVSGVFILLWLNKNVVIDLSVAASIQFTSLNRTTFNFFST